FSAAFLHKTNPCSQGAASRRPAPHCRPCSIELRIALAPNWLCSFKNDRSRLRSRLQLALFVKKQNGNRPAREPAGSFRTLAILIRNCASVGAMCSAEDFAAKDLQHPMAKELTQTYKGLL